MRVKVGKQPSLRSRRQACLRSLTAAGIVGTYDLAIGSRAYYVLQQSVEKAGFREVARDGWPTESATLVHPDGAQILYRDGDREAVYRLPDGTLASVDVGWGMAYTTVYGASQKAVNVATAGFRSLYPLMFFVAAEDDRIPITFWSYGMFGPTRNARMIDASPWADIQSNYTAQVREQLDGLMNGFKPGEGGQLILWQGPPGTGKTWALRALASEWASWAEFNYITDPDSFFVEHPDYMVDVLLADSYATMEIESGDLYEAQEPEGKWRVLILEDTGELLSENAKEKHGQGLSRLLNVVDGMIGQGLRILVLVTTNDELGELNAAVKRPGRCAAQIVFEPLTPEESSEWLGEDAGQPLTLAELYARSGQAAEEPLDVEAVVASGQADEPLEPALAAVVEAARAPLTEHDDPPTDPINDLTAAAAAQRERRSTLAIAAAQGLMEGSPLAQLIRAHERDAQVAQAILELAGEDVTAHPALAVISKGMDALRDAAVRPAPDVHVTVPEREVHVQVDGAQVNPQIDVHVPEQPPPVVTVEGSTIHVDVPEQPPQPAPVVNVTAAAPPDVHVTVQPPKPRPVRVEIDENGRRRYVPEDD